MGKEDASYVLGILSIVFGFLSPLGGLVLGIIGINLGKGKRASFGIGALLVGVYNKKDDNFETIAKVGTGLTDKQWKEQKKLVRGLTNKSSGKKSRR